MTAVANNSSRPASAPGRSLAPLLQAVEAVTAALDHEAAAIACGQPEALLEAVSEKARCLRVLEALGREPAVLALLTDDPQGNADLRRLIDTLRECEQRNLATGSVIVAARRDNELLLRSLGQQPEPGAYTARGNTAPGPGTRSLGRA